MANDTNRNEPPSTATPGGPHPGERHPDSRWWWGAYGRHAKTVALPVRFRDGLLETRFGVPIPELDERAMPDLVIPEHALQDQALANALTRVIEVEVLPAGTDVWLGYSTSRPSEVPEVQALLKNVLAGTDLALSMPSTYGFLPVHLRKPLRLRIRSLGRSDLLSCDCVQEDLRLDAMSLNNTYTQISERIQPKRASHTGNVFDLACCQRPASSEWVFLRDLRFEFEQRYFHLVQLQFLISFLTRWAEDHPYLHQLGLFPEPRFAGLDALLDLFREESDIVAGVLWRLKSEIDELVKSPELRRPDALDGEDAESLQRLADPNEYMPFCPPPCGKSCTPLRNRRLCQDPREQLPR